MGQALRVTDGFRIGETAPVVRGRRTAEATRATAAVPGGKAGVLVVDDEPDIVDEIASYLRDRGFPCDTAANGCDALKTIKRRQNIDVVVCDIRMPRLDGLEMTRRLHQMLPAERDIGVIVLTGHPGTQEAIRSLKLGAVDFLTKPVSLKQLHAAVEQAGAAVRGRRQDRQFREMLKLENTKIREVLAHYVAPPVIESLEANGERPRPGGEQREVTCLFTDIAGFTRLSEGLDPGQLVSLLNGYLDGMSEIVLKHGGMIDKFVGDAMVALFVPTNASRDAAQRAVLCALELDEFAQRFATCEAARGIDFGVTRIGVHTGPAVVGNIGGKNRFDYTATGDTVNTAARLEGANKYLGTRICVSGATASRCDGVPFRPIGELVLKGKTESVPAFEPLTARQATDEAVAAYRDAFEKLRIGDPAASDALGRLLAAHPGDALAAFHHARLAAGASSTRIEFAKK